jgi:hypothetical protein
MMIQMKGSLGIPVSNRRQKLLKLIQNGYGNYVAQSLFKYADESIKRKYYEKLNTVSKRNIASNKFSKRMMKQANTFTR